MLPAQCLADAGVVPVQIEIPLPNRGEGFSIREKHQPIGFFPHAQKPASRPSPELPVPVGLPAETLPAVQCLSQIKILSAGDSNPLGYLINLDNFPLLSPAVCGNPLFFMLFFDRGIAQVSIGLYHIL